MKLVKCLALTALLIVIVSTSINCIQGPTTPASTPTPTPMPTTEPLPASSLTTEQQINIYNTAIKDPYVKERILQTAWRTQHPEGGRLAINTSYRMGDVMYLRYHEISPGVDRMSVLPAAVIIPGDPEMAGINVVAFVNTTGNRVAYIGFVPRAGKPVDNVTFTSTELGIDERDPVWGLHQYNNVTIVDTGFVKNQSLTQAQIDRATGLAMTNATVRSYIGTHGATMRDVTVHGFETGYPHRYVIAYPLVTIDVVDGITRYDTIFVLADINNDRVAGIQHGSSYLW